MSKYAYVYALVDPNTDEIRYVGKTLHPDWRLERHLRDEQNTPKGHWIRELKRLGQKPSLKILEKIPINRADGYASERHWIACILESGQPLLNIKSNPEVVNGEAK